MIAYLEYQVACNHERFSMKQHLVMTELNDMLHLQIGLLKDLLKDKPADANLLALCDANMLEYLLRSLVPVVRLKDKKFVFGT